MSDRIEHACGKCGSLLHHADRCGDVQVFPSKPLTLTAQQIDIYTYAAKITGPEPTGDACTCDWSGPCDWHGATGKERELARELINYRDARLADVKEIEKALGDVADDYLVSFGQIASYVELLRRQRDEARAWRGGVAQLQGLLEWCVKNREEGRGPCGACAWCCKQALDRAERAEATIGRALGEAKTSNLTAAGRLANVCGILGRK